MDRCASCSFGGWPSKQSLVSGINPFPNDKFWTLPNYKSLQTTILSLMKLAESSLNG